MKRDRKRQLKDYSKFYEFEIPYYGLLYKHGKLRIDVKRLEKSYHGGQIDDEIIQIMKTRNFKTGYFIPDKEKYADYKFNYFKQTFKDLKDLWNNEFKTVLDKIKTPEEVGQDAFIGNLATGIYDYDECSTIRFMESFKRENKYYSVIKSLYSQFIHYMASVLEHVTLTIMVKDGYQDECFSRRDLDIHVTSKSSVSIKDYENNYIYDKFYSVWNFLKHNSLSTYKKVYEKYPDILLSTEYQNGQFALKFLKIDEEYVNEMLDKLILFYEELCQKAFKENTQESSWKR